MKKKRTLLRPLGSGLAMGVPLLLGILLKDPLIS